MSAWWLLIFTPIPWLLLFLVLDIIGKLLQCKERQEQQS